MKVVRVWIIGQNTQKVGIWLNHARSGSEAGQRQLVCRRFGAQPGQFSTQAC
jgi:hypothetical protein